MSKPIIAIGAVLVAAAVVFGLRNGADTKSVPPRAEPSAPSPSAPPERQEVPWADRVARASSWPLPAANRLPGVRESALPSTTEEWIAALPVDRQQHAREFALRHPVAYTFGSREQVAWMLDHGFPSLEEVAAFDFDRHTRDCNELSCGNAKVSALAADALLQRIDEAMPASAAGALERPDLAAEMTPEALSEMTRLTTEARNYIDRARDNGSTLFAAYLTAHLAAATGDIEQAEAAYAFAAACGDRRALALGGSANVAVGAALAMSQGGHRACGNWYGKPLFPD